MEAWLELMENEIIPLQVSKGMVIAGSFRGETDQSVYIWMRRFESEAERERLYAEVYESDLWTTSIAPRVAELINRETVDVKRLVSTRMSILK